MWIQREGREENAFALQQKRETKLHARGEGKERWEGKRSREAGERSGANKKSMYAGGVYVAVKRPIHPFAYRLFESNVGLHRRNYLRKRANLFSLGYRTS